MSAATSPGTGLAYGLQRVCAAWGFARSSFYAMKSRQQATAERPPAKRRGPKPSISDEALLVAIEADLEASPWEGEGHRKVWARLRVCRGIRVSRQAGAPGDAREQPALAPSLLAAVAEIPMSVRSSPMPPTLMWGTDGVRVFTVDDGGAGYSPPSSIGTPSASAGMCASEATASPPFSRSPWGLRGCMPRPPPVRRGGWPCGWITAPSICRTTSPTRSSSGASSRPTPSSNSPRPTASPRVFNRTLKERSSMAASTATSRSCGTPSAGVEQYNAQWIVEKNGYLSPAQARQAWHTAMSLRPAA